MKSKKSFYSCLHIRDILMCLFVMLNVFTTDNPSYAESSTPGPLVVHSLNSRYFADTDGNVVFLTGSHTWNNLQDIGKTDPPEPFDYKAYLDFLIDHNHNFMRLWRWEFTKSDMGSGLVYSEPHPWLRTGPGTALDGKLKFNLEQFNQAYFDRLRSHVIAAGNRGIYVSVMLFEGWLLHSSEEPWCWDGHPFNRENNVNGIDGDPDGNGRGIEIQTLVIPPVTALQEAYVRKVIETVNDLDNVLYEIVNESGAYSTEWQYHLIRFVKENESEKPKQHPVGMTYQYCRDKAQRGTNETLFASPADWISPTFIGGWRDNPPTEFENKVILSDTDHLWGIGGNRDWVWKSFCRGLNPIFMDRYGYVTPVEGEPKPQWVDHIAPVPANDPEFDTVRLNLGYVKSFADRMEMDVAVPRNDLSSTGYCLANWGIEYLIFSPESRSFEVDLTGSTDMFQLEWLDIESGESTLSEDVKGGNKVRLTVPFEGGAVAYLKHTITR